MAGLKALLASRASPFTEDNLEKITEDNTNVKIKE